MATLLLLAGILGCRDAQPGDLTGTWLMKDVSRASIPPPLERVSASIILHPDGTFVATDVPGLFYFPGRRAIQLESGSGTWKLVSREGKQQVQLDFQIIGGWNDALPYGKQLDVSKNSLFFFLGDPDEGKRISFERK